MLHLLGLALCAAGALAQSNSSVFDVSASAPLIPPIHAHAALQFPDYPPPGTPGPNATLGNAEAPFPNVASPLLADVYVHYDTGRFGTPIELVHAYFDYWPTVCVVSCGAVRVR